MNVATTVLVHSVYQQCVKSSRMNLLATFALYKSLLICCIYFPPQFDTSTILLLKPRTFVEKLAAKFVTWDSVYYLNSAALGPRFEHEFAFSPIWSELIGTLSPDQKWTSLSYTGVAIALCSSYLACLLLQRIGYLGGLSSSQSATAAKLYIASPAGAFLVAGYPESSFAMLSFLGILLFYQNRIVLSGAVFGLSCLLRSNGLLWGLLFLVELFRARTSKRFIRIVIGGSLVAIGFLYPQYKLWKVLCPERGEWCDKLLPLGYSYIQAKYWNVGFLRYWTSNNILNFLFAAPTLVLLILSLWSQPTGLIAVQLALFVGALAFWHVQIVTRVASCLPAPYWYVARLDNTRQGRNWKRYFVIWSMTQAALFGAFLPPA